MVKMRTGSLVWRAFGHERHTLGDIPRKLRAMDSSDHFLLLAPAFL